MDVPTALADGYAAAEYVWAYPPGIPLVVPGELVTDELLAALDAMQEAGTELHSTRGDMPKSLYVVEETI
jgi:arginine/lysine/ornithine decarboxylase